MIELASSATLPAPGRTHLSRFAALAAVTLALMVSGCRHHNQSQLPPPQAQAPPYQAAPPQTTESETTPRPSARIPITPVPPGGVSDEDLDYVATHRPILTQTGLATWYTAPYKGRKSANGEVFSDRDLTAAHRTLPMGSLIKVTNLQTGQSAAMRITDRGPFVEDRILDLTVASAKATGVYRVGMARVRMDVYETPKSINSGGRWCVQIGAFHNERAARKLKKQLLNRYSEANVIEFPGQDSYWVRIRPQGDNRQMAERIANQLRPKEGEAFLTRLD